MGMSFCITGLVMVEFVAISVIEMANQLQRLIFSRGDRQYTKKVMGSANSA